MNADALKARCGEHLNWAASRAQDEIAQRAWRWLQSIPDERLDQLLRTPARQVIIGGIFSQLPGLLDTRRATGVNTTIRWRITAPGDGAVDIYNVVIADGKMTIVRGEPGPEPRVTISVDAKELIRIATGSSNPLAAYFTGKLVVTGNVMAAAKVASLMRMPEPPSRRRRRGDVKGSPGDGRNFAKESASPTI
jgi:hypothetical protein